MQTHIERRHAITLTAPIERVFPLFTPKGEKLWVEQWNPQFLHLVTGETQEGMVFTTSEAGETTLWGCVEWSPAVHRVRYARVTPSSRFGFVEVACRALAQDRTEASVAYTFTALTASGHSYLEGLTEAAFEVMIDHWQAAIERYLIRSRRR